MGDLMRLSPAVTACTLAALLLTACGPSPDHEAPSPGPTTRADPGAARPASGNLRTSRALQLRAAMITSTLENSSTTLQYAYVENIHDGRGYTAGRAGFTTGTGDLRVVVKRYKKVAPKARIVKLLPALKRAEGSSSLRGLRKLPSAWRKAAADPRFRAIQDDVAKKLYLNPALALADGAHVRTPLGQAILYDTAIQHGVGGRNGLRAVLRETRQVAGDPRTGEAAWLRRFLDRRLWHLLHWTEGGFDQSAASSRARIATWRGLLADGAFRLDVPLTWTAYGDTCSIDARGRGSGPCR